MEFKYKPLSANGYFGVGSKPAHKPWQPPVTRDYASHGEVSEEHRPLRLKRGVKSSVVSNGRLVNLMVVLVVAVFVTAAAMLFLAT